MKIRAFLRPQCGWTDDVRRVLRKYALAYEDIDIDVDDSSRVEMERLSGQTYSPCVEIDGVMLADVSGEEVEDYLLSHHLVTPDGESGVAHPVSVSGAPAVAPRGAAQTIRFF
jgi:glutaredoxin